MLRTLKVLVVVTMLAMTLAAQSGSSRGPLEGTWKVTEIVVTGANSATTPNPQPGLFIFTRTHYSFMRVAANEPRPLFKAEAATNDEKLKAYDSFAGTTGTYDVSGTTLTIRPIVARSPNC